MRSLEILILDRSRKYGYVYWNKADDARVERFLNGAQKVEVIFQDSVLGSKNVDWSHRRISLGWKLTRSLPSETTMFRLTFSKHGSLRIVCR